MQQAALSVDDPHRTFAHGDVAREPADRRQLRRRRCALGDFRDRARLVVADPDSTRRRLDPRRSPRNRDRAEASLAIRANRRNHVACGDERLRVTVPLPGEEDGRESRSRGGGEAQRSRDQNDRPPPGRPRDGSPGRLDKRCLEPDRRKRLRQPLSPSLVEPDGAIEILQPLLPEVAQEDVQVLFLVLEERLGRLRYEHLAAVPGRADPCSTMYGEPRVATLRRDRLTRVQPHAHLDLGPVGPRMRQQRELALHRREHCLPSAGEGDEEGIALRVDLVTAVGCEGGSQQPLMVGKQFGVALAELLDQARRTLDVREQKRDRAARQLRHRRKRDSRDRHIPPGDGTRHVPATKTSSGRPDSNRGPLVRANKLQRDATS